MDNGSADASSHIPNSTSNWMSSPRAVPFCNASSPRETWKPSVPHQARFQPTRTPETCTAPPEHAAHHARSQPARILRTPIASPGYDSHTVSLHLLPSPSIHEARQTPTRQGFPVPRLVQNHAFRFPASRCFFPGFVGRWWWKSKLGARGDGCGRTRRMEMAEGVLVRGGGLVRGYLLSADENNHCNG